MTTLTAFDTQHEDIIHDAQMDYYGRRLATASSDRTVRIFEVEGSSHKLVQVLSGHEGPVWRVAWAHPKYGNVLASCSYDGKVLVWKETNGNWSSREYKFHESSVNSISWAPHEFGLILACGSSDGRVSILTFKSESSPDVQFITAHMIGCNAVSWAPATVSPSAGAVSSVPKRLVTGGCDNLVKIWRYDEASGAWKDEAVLGGHSDWVRDVAWANNVGSQGSIIASCSQDKQVFIWKQSSPSSEFEKFSLKKEKFGDVVWSVSWSVNGTILAVSCGDNKISLWKETLQTGEWECVSEMQEGEGPQPNER